MVYCVVAFLEAASISESSIRAGNSSVLDMSNVTASAALFLLGIWQCAACRALIAFNTLAQPL